MNPNKNTDPNAMVHAFLKTAETNKIAAIVIYGYKKTDGSSYSGTASNSNEVGTKAMLAFIHKTGTAAIEAGAKALHDKRRGWFWKPWDKLAEKKRTKIREEVEQVLLTVNAESHSKPAESKIKLS